MKRLIPVFAACLLCSLALSAQSPASKLTLEQRVKAIEDRDAILKILNAYTYLVDFGHDASQYTDLYTDDAIFQPNAANGATPTSPGASVGRAGIEKWIANEWQMRERLAGMGHLRLHMFNEPEIVVDGDRATARAYFQTTDNDNGRIYVVSIGLYLDKLVRSPDGHWRIKERMLQRQGGTGGAAPARTPPPGQ